MKMKTADGEVAKVCPQTSTEAMNGTKILSPVKVQPRSKVSVTVSTRSKVSYTAAIYLAYFSYGLGEMIVPTAMDDIVNMVKVDVATFSKVAMVSLTVVYCFAAIIGGSLSYLINRQLYLMVSLFISAGAKIWLPFTSTLLQATICEALSGLGAAGIDVATNAWLLAIWREESGSLMQTMHFCFAVGTSLSPLLTEHFLSDKNTTNVSVNETTTLMTMGNQTTDIQTMGNQTVIQSESQIHIPLFTSGALYLVSTLSFALLHFVAPYDERNERLKEKEEKDLNTSSFSPRLSKLVLAIASLILMFDVGSEASTFDYNTVFVIRNGFNPHKAAFVSSVKSISFTLSRAVAAVVAVKVPIRIVLYSSICINAIGNGMILYSTKLAVQPLPPTQSSGDTWVKEEMVTKETMIWLGFAFIGFGFGPLYPAVLSFVQQYIKLTTFICGVFVFVGAWSTILNFLLVGKFIEEYVNVLTYFNLISITGVAISFILLDVIVRKMTMFKYRFGNKI